MACYVRHENLFIDVIVVKNFKFSFTLHFTYGMLLIDSVSVLKALISSMQRKGRAP